MSEESSNSVIRITKEEAVSTHVDDLLKRQMSMRGEPGVARDHRRKWYFQNWLVLALAGALGAFVAWACLEPFFDDQIYVQGEVKAIRADDRLPNGITLRGDLRSMGSFQLNAEKIFFLDNLRELGADGHARREEVTVLREGATIGVYVDFVGEIPIATFVVGDPPPQSPARAAMTLNQLEARSRAAGLLIFCVVASCIGLFIGSVDGLICRLPRRALLAGGVGVVVGFVGGFLVQIVANIAYNPLTELAASQMAKGGVLGGFGFFVQMVGRSLAWALIGTAMGVGQGIALRSGRLVLYGLIGGVLGGLFGGMLFDPIDLILLGRDKTSAHWSRLIGFMVIGASVGGMIGLVELLARDAWLRMTQGPLTGKEFLLFKDSMLIGSSPRSDLYLFNDPQVARQHAVIRTMGDECEIEARDSAAPVMLNNRPIQRSRLRHGDNVAIGRTTFVFQRRKG